MHNGIGMGRYCLAVVEGQVGTIEASNYKIALLHAYIGYTCKFSCCEGAGTECKASAIACEEWWHMFTANTAYVGVHSVDYIVFHYCFFEYS